MRNLPPYLSKYVTLFQRHWESSRNSMLSLCFPWPCTVCSELQVYPDVICRSCRGTLQRIEPPFCRICGSPFPDSWQVRVCPDCKLKRPRISRIRSVFLYEGVLTEMVRLMKFHGQARFVRYFAEELYLFLMKRIRIPIEAIVPVPLHRSREWERTFDQAGLLAMHLHAFSGIPLKKILIRRKNTVPQSSLSGSARRKNLLGAFQIKNGSAAPRSVLLIDDVVTTGATLEACAAVLRKAGARKVYGLTIARAPLK